MTRSFSSRTKRLRLDLCHTCVCAARPQFQVLPETSLFTICYRMIIPLASACIHYSPPVSTLTGIQNR